MSQWKFVGGELIEAQKGTLRTSRKEEHRRLPWELIREEEEQRRAPVEQVPRWCKQKSWWGLRIRPAKLKLGISLRYSPFAKCQYWALPIESALRNVCSNVVVLEICRLVMKDNSPATEESIYLLLVFLILIFLIWTHYLSSWRESQNNARSVFINPRSGIVEQTSEYISDIFINVNWALYPFSNQILKTFVIHDMQIMEARGNKNIILKNIISKNIILFLVQVWSLSPSCHTFRFLALFKREFSQ